jgi:hypothetical protein
MFISPVQSLENKTLLRVHLPTMENILIVQAKY